MSKPNNLKVLAIWMIACSGGLASTLSAIGNAQYDSNPQLVTKLPFSNGLALEKLVEQATIRSAMKNRDVSKISLDADVKRKALLAFVREPMAFDAIRAMAIIKHDEGKPIVARKLMRNLATLTKRDSLANNWLIYDYGRLGDIGQVLQYYDMTMRASVGSSEVLMPVMVRALESNSSIDPFAAILQNRPPWEGQFWKMASNSEKALDNALNLRTRLLNDGIDYPMAIDLELVNQLVQYKKYTAAHNLYSALDKDKAVTARPIVNDSTFAESPTLPPFDWTLYGTGEYGAFISPSSHSMSISATANAGGIVARQLIVLRPGSFRLTIETDYEAGNGPIPISSRIACANDGEKGRKNPIFRSADQEIGGVFTVNSPACRYYWLEVLALPTDDVSGYDITVSKIDVQPLKQSASTGKNKISQ